MATNALGGYDAQTAEMYDSLFASSLDTDAAVDALARLAGTGPVLELGVGTGRIAVPLAQRGVQVHGIDSSSAMLDKLRAKPTADNVHVIEGDMCAPDPRAQYSLIFAAFNTLFALNSQEDQVECIRGAAHALAPNGVLVVEGFVINAEQQRTTSLQTGLVDERLVVLDARSYDPVEQVVSVQHVLLADGKVRLLPMRHRYAPPAEIDLMASLAGLSRRHRWQDWSGADYGPDSTRCISVYGPRDDNAA